MFTFRWRRWFAMGAALATAVLIGTGCGMPQTNFSQAPGFADYFAAHPPRRSGATPAEQALLERYRPRIYLAPRQERPIDFYSDYIAQGRLEDGAGRLLSDAVTPKLLNANANDPAVVFTHVPDPSRPGGATVLGRVDHAELDTAGKRTPLTFLTYHLVFRNSGLAAGFDGWRASLLGLIAPLDDWHQLDHYTAASVVLDASERPVALMMQQHNYHHTYAFGDALQLPADGRVGIDVALRSNELYPHAAGPQRHRAVRFGSVAEMRYLISGDGKPMIAADDLTDGTEELDYILAYLPPSDAFYTFKGFLGARRRLPGRDGPPGADFNALPAAKPLTSQLLLGFWRNGNQGDLDRLTATYAKSGDPLDFARAQEIPFLKVIGAAP